MTSRLSPRNSSKSISTPMKQLAGTEAFFSPSLDDIPFEIEGYYNSMVPVASGTWNSSQTETHQQVRYPGSTNPTSTPLKRHLPEDMKSEKKMKMDCSGVVNHSWNISSNDAEEGIGDVAAKVENYLQIYNQYKNVKSERKEETESYLFKSIENDLQLKDDEALEDFERHEGHSLLKERLNALRFDHCYTRNVQYFKCLDEEDYSGSNINMKTVNNEDEDFFELNQNEISEANPVKEEKLLIMKTEVASSPAIEQQSDEAFPVVSETQENIEGKESFEDDFEEEEFTDEIGPLDDDEELLKSDDQVSPFDENCGQPDHTVDGKTPESSPFSDNVVDDLDQMMNLEDEIEELLVEEYDELDSFEKKEIEEQLSEDFTEEFEEESALDVSDILTSFSGFDFESLDSNFLLRESNENFVLSPSNVKKSETCLDPEKLKAEFSFRSESDRSDQLLGSDGNSSSCSDESSSPPPSVQNSPICPKTVESQGPEIGGGQELANRVEVEGLYQEEWEVGHSLHHTRKHGCQDQVWGDGVHEAVGELHHGGS